MHLNFNTQLILKVKLSLSLSVFKRVDVVKTTF